VKKNNYGPVTETIVLRWRDGVYVVEARKGTLEQLAAEAEIDHLFLTLLRRFTEQGRNVSDNKGPTYAPAKFAETPEAKGAKITSRMLADAMERLFNNSKIEAKPEGSPSRKRSRLIEITSEEASR
jgi:RecA-family ATPase